MNNLKVAFAMAVMLLIACSDLWAGTDPFEEFYPKLYDYWTTTENIVIEVGQSGTLARIISPVLAVTAGQAQGVRRRPAVPDRRSDTRLI